MDKSKLRRIGSFILRGRTIVVNMDNNKGYFPAPSPALPVVTGHLDDLEAAEAVAKTRVAGAAAARNLKYDLVLDDLNSLLGYVQNLADYAADEPAAIAIINASGFSLKNHGIRVKPQLAVRNMPVDGQVKLTAKSAGPRVSYEWQQSADGAAWTDLPSTLQAKTLVNGLAPGSKMYFRFRNITKNGAGAYSSAVSTIVT